MAAPAQDMLSAAIAVIGSGPGGAITALRCAEAGFDTLMIEEGALHPPARATDFSPDEMRLKVRSSGLTVGLGRAAVSYWEGRCVGGGSEVNRGLYHRPLPAVLEAWAKDFAVDALGPDEIAAHSDACEAIAAVEFLPGPAPLASQKLADGAAALGWRHGEVPRLFSYGPDWQRGDPGTKQSMSATAVPRFTAAGGRLVTGTRVERLRREDGTWRLLAESGGRRVEIRAATVFVACGAVQSAALLRRSGIRRHVGDSLAFHPMIKAAARFPEEVSGDFRLDPVHQVKEFDPRFSLGASVSTPATLTFTMTDRLGDLDLVARDWRHLGAYYAQTTGGRGTVRVLPGFADALVRVRTDPRDMADLADGLRRLAECLFAAGAETVYPNIAFCPPLSSTDDLRHLPEALPAGRVSLSTLHLFSSCPMGERDGTVADSFGRVRGADGLHLADSSLLPGPTVVNPQGSVMAVAHRNVTRFLEGRRRAAQRTHGGAPRPAVRAAE